MRYRNAWEDLRAAAGLLMCAAVVALIVCLCVWSYRDAQVRDGVVVAKDYTAGYFAASGKSMVWQPPRYVLTVHGRRVDTGEERDASVSVPAEEYDRTRVGDAYHR